MNNISSTLIFIGATLIVVGIVIKFLPLIKLPGDILIKKQNFTFYFPVVTCIVISIILTLLLYIVNLLKK
jgi:hypothetical protein